MFIAGYVLVVYKTPYLLYGTISNPFDGTKSRSASFVIKNATCHLILLAKHLIQAQKEFRTNYVKVSLARWYTQVRFQTLRSMSNEK